MVKTDTGTTFCKGQLVTFFQNWDSKGTIRIVDLQVYSCGSKQMVLVDELGKKFEGMHFLPTIKQSLGGYSEVHPRMTKEEAIAHALVLGAAVVVGEREQMLSNIAHYGYPESHAYNVSLRSKIDTLHEPRVVVESHVGQVPEL